MNSESIVPGCMVWIEGRRVGKVVRRYARVMKRTRTQIVVTDPFCTHFHRDSGVAVPLSGLGDHIVGIATIEQIAAFDMEQAAAKESERLLLAEEMRLREILPPCFEGKGPAKQFVLARAGAAYILTIVGLSAGQIRAAVAAIKGAAR